MELLTRDMMAPGRRGLTTAIPLIDVVFLLLIFFITASVRRPGTELALRAPEKPGVGPGVVDREDRFRRVDVRVVPVAGGVRYEVDNVAAGSRDDLVTRLQALKDQSKRPLLVVVDDAPGAGHGDVIRVFDVCTELEIENVTLLPK